MGPRLWAGPEGGRGPARRLAAGLLLLLCALLPLSVAQGAPQWQLSLAELRSSLFSLAGLQLRQRDDGFVLQVAELAVGELRWSALRLDCPHGELGLSGIRCARGTLSLAGQALPLHFALEATPGEGRFVLLLDFDEGGSLRLQGFGEEGQDSLQLQFDQLPVRALQTALAAALPPVLAAASEDFAALGVDARLDGEVRWQPQAAPTVPALKLALQLSEGAFASADGLQAGEALALQLAAEVRRDGSAWQWQATLDWDEGAIYLHPLYLEAGPRLQAGGRLEDRRLLIEYARLELEGVRQLALRAALALAPLRLEALAFSAAGADLAIIGPRWLTPLLAPALAERLHYAGHVGVALRWEEDALQRLDVAFNEAGISLRLPPVAGGQASGWSFGPLSGHLPWRHDRPRRGVLEIGGGRWGALQLGAFRLEAELAGRGLSLPALRIPVLDSALVINELKLALDPDAGWLGEGSVVVEPLSMAALSTALGWPPMGGRLSASLPGMRIRGEEIRFDGALVVSLFDGYVQATGLQVHEAFGLTSRLSADIEVRHLDLGQLTETFSLGGMTGFVDMDLKGLELLRWEPVAFDLRLVTTPGSGGGRISQRAVQNISALGGGGALAALQRGVLGFFNSFGYRALGLSCVLRDGVCHMGGLDDGGRGTGDAERFMLVRGGGIPALDVIGYNSRVDWQELLERVQRVLEDDLEAQIH